MNDMKMKKQLMRLLGCAAFVLVLLCIGTNKKGSDTIANYCSFFMHIQKQHYE